MFDPIRLVWSAILLFVICLLITWFITLAIEALFKQIKDKEEMV